MSDDKTTEAQPAALTPSQENPQDTYYGTQRDFFRAVVDKAVEHGKATNHDPNAILSDLCANLLTTAMTEEPSGQLFAQIMLKAQTQAEVILQNRAARFEEEARVRSTVAGQAGRA